MRVVERLRDMKHVGKYGRVAGKGDYAKTVPKRKFEVVDEVSVIVGGDTRYALEKLRFEDGSEVIRAPYWTLEG